MDTLFHRTFDGPEGVPLIILHGMLGSSRNWNSVAPELAQNRTVYTLDLRNHGESFHADSATFPEMSQDIITWMDRQGVASAQLLGHSLGGKVAMLTAVNHPKRVSALVVADIAPKEYHPHFQKEIDALLSLDLSSLKSRGDAESRLAETVPDFGFRRFLLTNLTRSNGAFTWQSNLRSIREHLQHGSSNPLATDITYHGAALFVRGETSDFVRDRDLDSIRHHFPNAEIETIPKAGHFLHVENREAFVECVKRFLAAASSTRPDA